MKAINKMLLQEFPALSGAAIQGLLHPAGGSPGYFLAWFQSLQLPSTQSESQSVGPLAAAKLKSNKAPGPHKIIAEVTKREGSCGQTDPEQFQMHGSQSVRKETSSCASCEVRTALDGPFLHLPMLFAYRWRGGGVDA
jgi:hypothetical protein